MIMHQCDNFADDDYDYDGSDGGDDEKGKAVLLQHEKVQLGKRRKKMVEL